MKPPIKQVHKTAITTTASGLIGARPFHQPVLNIQTYIDDCPFSCDTMFDPST